MSFKSNITAVVSIEFAEWNHECKPEKYKVLSEQSPKFTGLQIYSLSKWYVDVQISTKLAECSVGLVIK